MADTDLITRARATRVVVIGGGIAGLVAARECARVGFAVTLLEAGDRLGGCLAAARLDGLRVDVVADSYAPAAQGLIDDLGLGDHVVDPATTQAWITGLAGAGGAAPMPADTIAGIPANPWAEDVRRVIGWGGAWRAYLDRLRPPLTIGRQANLGTLVRSRLGERVADRLVAPLARGVYGVDPSEVDADAAVPGLSTALTRLGSLSGAIGDLLVDAADGARRSLRGGMTTLVDALAAELGDLDVEIRTGAPAERLERSATHAASAPGAAWTVAIAGDEPVPADVVIVATARTAARHLLATAGVTATGASGPAPVEVVTLLIDSVELDAAPRGAVAYPLSGPAAVVVQADAAWAWLAEELGRGRHVVRVRLPAAADRDDEATTAVALAAASAALGVPLAASDVRAVHRTAVEPAAPASVLGHTEAQSAIRREVGAVPGLAVVGAWVAGAGIARTAADAVAEADRVRRAVLWDSAISPDVNPQEL